MTSCRFLWLFIAQITLFQIFPAPGDADIMTASRSQFRLPNSPTEVSSRHGKRAYKRACKRAMQHGFTWYRGQVHQVHDFPQHLRGQITLGTPARPMTTAVNSCHRPKKRLTCFSWNTGGLSSSRFRELSCWMHVNGIQLFTLQETKWSFSSHWEDKRFFYIHSGSDKTKSGGILFAIARKLVTQKDLSWEAPLPGHLLRVRLNLPHRFLDIFCCYQYALTGEATTLEARQRWWTCLDTALRQTARRHGLLLLGDFSCTLPFVPGGCGATNSNTNTHSDHHRFTDILHSHDLVALNSWHDLGPTYKHHNFASHLDYLFTRTSMADGAARSVKYIWDAHFQPPNPMGHAPMLTTILYTLHNTIKAQHTTCTIAERARMRQAWRAHDSNWTRYLNHVHHHLSQRPPTDSLDHYISQLHDLLTPTVKHHFAQDRVSSSDCASIIRQKWQARQSMFDHHKPTLFSILQVWRHYTRFRHLDRQCKLHAKFLRTDRLARLSAEVTAAANRHDAFAMRQVIRKRTPKQRPQKIQLRNSWGHLATPCEEIAILKTFICTEWAGPDLPTPHLSQPCHSALMNFTNLY